MKVGWSERQPTFWFDTKGALSVNPRKLKQLKKSFRHQPLAQQKTAYIDRMTAYYQEFTEYPAIKLLISNVLLADKMLAAGDLPQQLPLLQLPDNSEDLIYQNLNQKFPKGDPVGDKLWDKLIAALPHLDHDLRYFRDYLEEHYGMWAYTPRPFISDLADFVGDRAVLEVMAGNGYISKGLRDAHKTVYATDSQTWTSENETGRHPLTAIEPLSALDAFHKYQDQVGVVVMSWSPDGLPLDWELLQAIRQANAQVDFVVIGEPHGATGSAAFWDNAEFIENADTRHLNRHYTAIDLIKDHVFLVK
ncbi:SAM-dependent methyltransferase [Levilactobacillus spicheri DSM 15429]|uniref:SAM-dependent methyltransferase n=1 Tax=Levilactobacillus spicheri DSM 15429 TaxID=1423805 RepID=A0A0R1R234_9LACO|nr:SAM-dependent methyltransferase [Levilactobacillus spicheri DSM 15429]